MEALRARLVTLMRCYVATLSVGNQKEATRIASEIETVSRALQAMGIAR